MGSVLLSPATCTMIMFKVVLFSALLAVCLSQGYKGEEAPKPYSYQYAVADDYSKANFHKAESQDANGNVKGQFVIALPDGRIQTTAYTADHVHGFIADVTYQGEPVYPEQRPYKPVR